MVWYWARALAGFGSAAVISAIAYRVRALSPSGVLAASAVGGATVCGAGFRGGAALVTFFASATLLGRLPGSRRLEQQRGNERDAVQVLANGGVAAILALISAASVRPSILVGFGGAIAAATADTWATEIGSRSRQHPRSVATLRPVARGTSGGATWAGLAASATGAATIAGVVATGSSRRNGVARNHIIAVTLGGFTGALADSLLGATVQEVRFCDACRQERIT